PIRATCRLLPLHFAGQHHWLPKLCAEPIAEGKRFIPHHTDYGMVWQLVYITITVRPSALPLSAPTPPCLCPAITPLVGVAAITDKGGKLCITDRIFTNGKRSQLRLVLWPLIISSQLISPRCITHDEFACGHLAPDNIG